MVKIFVKYMKAYLGFLPVEKGPSQQHCEKLPFFKTVLFERRISTVLKNHLHPKTTKDDMAAEKNLFSGELKVYG